MTSRGAWLARGSIALLLLPLATGVLEVTYRDAVITHIPGKVAMVEALRAGRFPFLNPYASCGQPLAGNPNHEVFFPDALLFLALPLPIAFGLHFALAALLAYAGARRLARAEGASRETAEVVGLAFVTSGVFVSAWTMYNSAMALAMAPWVVAGAAKLARRVEDDRRGGIGRAVAGLAIVGALEVLAGEPVLALLVALACAVRLAAGAPVRRAIAPAVGAALLAGLLAAPLLLCTWQAARGTSRDLAHFAFDGATATSVHPARLLEQATPFPFGRPDVMGGEHGFSGQRFFEGDPPYLWTLQLGWVPLLLLLAFGGARRAAERASWAMVSVALVLALGAYLPGARLLYPLLSLGGRLRYPVKWWYLVLLALVPLLAGAGERWRSGARLSRARRIAVLAAFCALVVTGASLALGDGEQLAAVITSTAAAGVLLLSLREGASRRPALLLACVGIPALVAMAPLVDAALDRPASSIDPLPPGRLFERAEVVAHGEEEVTTREFFRRVQRQGWALTGALSGIPYAFDADPEGSYSYHDRIVREAVDSFAWPDRAAELQLAGVSYVIAREELTEPYRLREVLDSERGVRLYDLDGAAPSVRRVGRIFRAPHFNATVAIHRSTIFDSSTDVVLPGKESIVEGEREAGMVHVESETPDHLVAEVDGLQDGVVVWSRTYFPAWRATVDGRKVPVLAADGHLVGVMVPAGPHQVEIVWPWTPLAVGTALFVVGVLVSGVLLPARRRR